MDEDLEPIEKAKNSLQTFYLPSNSGEVHRYYRKSEADKVIANKDAEISRLKRALYKACSNWAMAEAYSVLNDVMTSNRWIHTLRKLETKMEKYK